MAKGNAGALLMLNNLKNDAAIIALLNLIRLFQIERLSPILTRKKKGFRQRYWKLGSFYMIE